MRLYPFIIILPFLWWADAYAQEPEQMLVPEEWQLTLDVIKSKAQNLMVENNDLQVAYRQLIEVEQKLQQSIDEQQYRNAQMSHFLSERHGRSDQQVRVDDLTQTVNTKKQEVRNLEEESGALQRKQTDLEAKIQQLKYTISGIQLHQQDQKQAPQPASVLAQPLVDDQLIQLRKQLEEQNRQEVLLENELGVLKNGDQSKNLNADAIEEENRQLEARLNVLRLQKIQYDRRSADTKLSQASARMYEKLKMRKEQLEASIYAYEMRLDQLRDSTLTALSWPLRKKKMIHEMVQTDARNNQMRGKIKELKEDIDVLRDQVAKLERRVDFVQGKQIAP